MTEQFATKQDLADAVAPLARDLAALRVEFKADLAETEHRITDRLTAAFRDAQAETEHRITDKLTEAIRDAQTEVLRAFYD